MEQGNLFDIEPDEDPIVYWHVIQCPVKRCRGSTCPVQHTDGRIRHHKCSVCGKCFKSIEAPLIPPDLSIPESGS